MKDNKKARELQKQIIAIHGAEGSNENTAKLESLQKLFEFHLFSLPTEAKELDKNGYIIPWQEGDNNKN